MRLLLSLFTSIICCASFAQNIDLLRIKGNYTNQDSINITKAYLNAGVAVDNMYAAMIEIWQVDRASGQSKKEHREENWIENENFMTWLGKPTNMGKAHRIIKKLHTKFAKKFVFEVIKEDKGKCGRFVAAWALPYGKVNIRLCRNFVNFGPHNQEKVLIHELGHEVGLLFDRGVYHCSAALSVAANPTKNRATQRPENYSWLAMSYLGVTCKSRY